MFVDIGAAIFEVYTVLTMERRFKPITFKKILLVFISNQGEPEDYYDFNG
ncbi:MAG: hypothetical protein ACI9DG_002345 [Oleispira sp.]|jgi:hypothetical protein